MKSSVKGEYFGNLDDCRNIVLLAHGLNLNPKKMDDLSGELVERGCYVFRIELNHWQNDIGDAIEFLVALADKREKDLVFIGYSLGALLAIDYLFKNKKFDVFSSMVLLAPALSLKWYTQLLRLFKFLPDNLGIPSLNFKDYRHKKITYISEYNELIRVLDRVSNSIEYLYKLNQIPTLFVMNKADEMVSSSGVKSLVEKYGSNCWNYLEVESSSENIYNHLIIDKFSVKEKHWLLFLKELEEILS